MRTFGIIGGTMVFLLTGMFGYMYRLAKKRQVVHHSMNIVKDLKSQNVMRLLFISDIHRRTIDKALMKKIQVYGPLDAVIIGGDAVEAGVPIGRLKNNLRQLTSLGKSYFVWGNNDREIGEDVIRRLMKQYGVHILDNENCTLLNHPEWGICGTDDPSSGKVDIARAMTYIEKYTYTIFVSHNPSLFKKAEQFCLPTLCLGGHTHGGQIRVGSFAMHPLGAFKVHNNRAKLISNGFGTTLVPLRFGAEPETHVIEIMYS